jgi:4-diphosphocytidyl-2-C-methyl-D-erythritol kinase
MIGPRQLLGLPAPAKINLFLHVLGRRADGYHEIQSAFVPIALWDTLDFASREDGQIVRHGDLTGPMDADLAVRAARALQWHAAQRGAVPSQRAAAGVTIRIEKRIPVGAGLGGGSSDAATTLIALNRLWDLRLSREALNDVGRQLGADVPFFLGDGAAFVEGLGERCSPLRLPATWFVVVFPGEQVSTAEIFADPKLTRDTKGTTISGFSAALCEANSRLFGTNDLEPVVRSRHPLVGQALDFMGRYGPARMSGSGSAVYCVMRSAAQAQQTLDSVRAQLPPRWSAWAVSALEELPLADWLRVGA